MTISAEYHRLARIRPRYRWWRVLLTGLFGAAMYLTLMFAILIPAGIVAAENPGFGSAFDAWLNSPESFDLNQPWLFVALMVPLILMLPALFLASRIVEGRGAGLLSSVAGRIRWGWLARTLLLALAVYAVYFAVLFALAALSGESIVIDASHPGIALMLVLVLLLVPLQAAAEEYVFRGYLMQLIGGWLRHPAFAILLPAPLFVIGHGYDLWGGLSVGVFAIVAAWLSWRTGGLEAAISMHIVNNVLIFVLGSFSLVDANATEGAPADLIASAITMIVYALLADRWARTRGLARTATAPTAPTMTAPTATTAE
ncbi:lysostaphin resistance A-like protein [Microbacterium sp. A84]|uniref:CPBP family intramembrane glutamic endopeptidase n=1 Tax=Microbacterium sp. A84 TaxID=3450715 RepID=UPI003F44303B